MRIAVTGAGGFIGSHLVRRLKAEGHAILGIDVKLPEFGDTVADDFALLDLSRELPPGLLLGFHRVYHLAADMGGMGYLADHDAHILATNIAIDRNVFDAAVAAVVPRIFYSSSACVYPEGRQTDEDAAPLSECDAWPADPDTLYGLEKLTAERMLLGFHDAGLIEARVARFHNVYGPEGAWTGGREKAPAALCRKVAEAVASGTRRIDVWGDGKAQRSFLYIDDCLDGIVRLTESDTAEPLNIGSDRAVSVDELVGIVAAAAGVKIAIDHVPGPQGVRARNSYNRKATRLLGWQPSVTLEDGIALTYRWVAEQVSAAKG